MQKNYKLTYNLMFMMVLGTFLFGFSHSAASQFTVTGTVSDENTGDPLIGVTIQVRDTGRGVVTNTEGEFEIDLTGSSADLVFSYVGYQTKTFAVDAGTGTLNVTLRQDIAELGEVVVSGLGTTVKRQNLANSVSSISAAELTGYLLHKP